MTFGWIDNCLVLSLLGNPASVTVACLMFAWPLLLKRMGVELAEPLLATTDFQFRRKWLRVRLHLDRERKLVVGIYHPNSSEVLSSLFWVDRLVELPEDCAGVVPGDTVEYLPFGGLRVGIGGGVPDVDTGINKMLTTR